MTNSLSRWALFALCLTTYSLAISQSSPLKISGGLLYSNIESDSHWLLAASLSAREGDYVHPWRRGGWVTLEKSVLSKRLFQFDLGLTYQERPPLEVFPFATAPQAGVNTFLVLADWPSNPQNPIFNDPSWGGVFERFPNFKYLHLEVMPSFKYGGERFSLLAGIGLFGGWLLNQRGAARSIDDFSAAPTQVIGGIQEENIRYTSTDLGFLPKLEVRYAISERLSVGLLLKHYWSVYRLNDTLVSDFDWRHNVRWRVFAGGLSAQYMVGKGRQVSGF